MIPQSKSLDQYQKQLINQERGLALSGADDKISVNFTKDSLLNVAFDRQTDVLELSYSPQRLSIIDQA